jgi:hypothetical protein
LRTDARPENLDDIANFRRTMTAPGLERIVERVAVPAFADGDLRAPQSFSYGQTNGRLPTLDLASRSSLPLPRTSSCPPANTGFSSQSHSGDDVS